MDSSSFDRLTRLFASSRSRRTLAGALLGSITGLLGAMLAEEVEAHNPLPACRKITNKAKRAACVRKAKAHNRNVHCVGVRCPAVANGTLRCRRGKCVALTCASGFANCDGNVRTGCEANLQASAQHCSTCNNPCASEQGCCNGSCLNLNTVENCGRCGRVCPGQGVSGQTVRCMAGKCQLERTFSFQGVNLAQAFVAPAAGTLTVEARGGGGGRGNDGEISGFMSGGSGAYGGGGGQITGTFNVSANEELRLIVGGVGWSPLGDEGGFGGGNGASDGTTAPSTGGSGGGGGGPSDIRRSPYEVGDRLLVAGGGGGGGGGASGSGSDGGRGGDGGPSVGGIGGAAGIGTGDDGVPGQGGRSAPSSSTTQVQVLSQRTGTPGSPSGPGQPSGDGSIKITWDAVV